MEAAMEVTTTGAGSEWKSMVEEVKRVSYIAMPMVVVALSNNLLQVASVSMVGHIGELQLAGTALANSLANVTGFSVLFGLSCGLETLCGQSYGAGLYEKLATYTYSGIVSLLLLCIPISILWIFMDKLLILMGQDPLVAAEAHKFIIYLIPSLFPYAILQSLNRFLLSQTLILPMLFSSVSVLMIHIPICWAFIYGLNIGNVGAALAIGLSHTLNAIFLRFYVKYSSACKNTAPDLSFSKELFSNIRDFLRFGVPTAVMICLEWWCFEIVLLVSGLLQNPKLETSVLSISLTISALHYYIPYAFGAAASTWISNELGAGNPAAAKRAVWITMVLGLGEVIIASTILLICRSFLGYAFGNSKEVVEYVNKMTPFISFSLIVDACSAILCELGVARGSGWQHIGAFINLGSHYFAGIPTSLVLGFVVHLKVKGLWIGLTVGTLVQCILLALVTWFTDWEKQAAKARERIFEGRISEEKC